VLGTAATGVLAAGCFALGARATTGCGSSAGVASSACGRAVGTGCNSAAVCFDLRPRAGAVCAADESAAADDETGTGRNVVAALAACAIGVATFARP
jgi:hypothetical protein